MTVAYVTMPGTSGNYVSTADVNLLNADQAHLAQSKANWRNQIRTDGGTLTADSGSRFGPNVLRFVCSGGGDSIFNSGAAGVANIVAAASTLYAAGLHLASPDGLEARVTMQWWLPAPTYLGQVVGSWTNIGATATFLSVSGTSHASTERLVIVVEVRKQGGASPDASDVVDLSAVGFRTGADGTFVPSLRIVGDLDMRARFAATDATPASAETLIGQRSGNSGYAMTLGTGGELVVYHGTGSGTRAETSSGLTLVAATDTEVQSTLDISAGTWTHYKNGVQFDTSGSFATTAGSPFAGPLAVGADSAGTSGNWDGNIYYAEVRDGIDGPVVRRMDADDLIGLV